MYRTAKGIIFLKQLSSNILTGIFDVSFTSVRKSFNPVCRITSYNVCYTKLLRVATLQDRERLVLYPEGSHLGEHRLRSMKKGIARIAFQAEKQNDFKLGLKIVPTGVDYSHYVNFRSNLLINYGKPIEVARYKELYEQNEQKAMTQLMRNNFV